MKTAVITGGNRGLGFAQTQFFLEKGWNVIVVARSRGELVEDSDNLLFLETDLANWRDTSWLDAAKAHTGRMDCLVNNAGIHLKKPIWDVTPDELESVLDINLKAVFAACGRYAQLANDGGSIVNVSSVAGLVGTPSALALPAPSR